MCTSGLALAQEAAPATPASTTTPSASKVPAAATTAPAATTTAQSGQGTAEVPSVTVSAERPTNRIDRQVYDVKSDVSSTNGSAADALNNVPSVSVDPDGTVSLRGSTHVQIYVDGKPSAMLQGDNRGPSLQAMPSEDIDSVEVINNPGAEFGNEAGGGPILNLVMKRVRKQGGFGVVNANAGTAGRYNTATSGSWNSGRLQLQGGVNFRHDGRNSVADVERERIDPATGESTRSTQGSVSKGLNDSAGLNGSVNYNLGDMDTIGAGVSFLARTNDQNGLDRYITFGDGGTSASDYQRTTQRGGDSRNYAASTRWEHKGELRGETFKLDLRVSSSSNDSATNYANAYSVRPPGAHDSASSQGNNNSTKMADLTGDYERPDDIGLLKLGFKVFETKSEFDALFEDIDPVTGARIANPRRSNDFALDQRNLAAYASYQWRPTERFGLLGGLRTEYTHLDIDQVTAATSAANHYINYIPSAFATYKVSDETNIRLAYARRLRRANASDLNPFVVYRDELNESAGNPQLQPALTDSIELGLETHAAGLEANLRGYYRDEHNAILYRHTFINDTVVLTTPENGAGSRSGGLEFTLSGKLTPRLSINTSGNLARVEQQQLDGAGTNVQRTASSLSMRGRFNYQLTDVDHVQVAINAQGKTLNGQGYRQPTTTTNFSLRHNLTPALSLVMNVTDVFNKQKVETITDTDTLKETNLRHYDGRIVYVGLSWRFGGVGGGGRGMHGGGPGAYGGHGPGA
jgi:outer membrane receptor protein involved in Fe transport